MKHHLAKGSSIETSETHLDMPLNSIKTNYSAADSHLLTAAHSNCKELV